MRSIVAPDVLDQKAHRRYQALSRGQKLRRWLLAMSIPAILLLLKLLPSILY